MKFYRKHNLTKNIAFIDGQSGSGKSLIGPIASSLGNAEYWLHNPIFEQIIILLSYKKITIDAARTLLETHADINLYNLLIGRDVNFRDNDTSGVSYGGVKNLFKKRIKFKDGDNIVKKIFDKNPFLLINTHHLLMNSRLVEKVLNKRNVIFISVARNPITIIKNFYNNNWENKYTKNPREFTLSILGNKNDMNVWYLNKYQGKNLSFIEKYANFVVDYQNYQKKLTKKNHLLIKYEEFIRKPSEHIKKLESYFGKRSNITKNLLKSFNLPRMNCINTLERDTDEVFSFIKNEQVRKKINLACKQYN